MEQTNTKSVGRFELLRLLGREGRVCVYRAHDPHLDRDLTIRLADFSDLDQEFRDEYDRRVRAMSDLRHSNLSAVLDFGQVDGLDFLATTYVDGQSLTEVIRQNLRIEPKQVALLVGKLALAVGQLHSAKLLHGYLSPDSVFIAKGGEPVIADLGVATEFRSTQNDETSAFRSEFLAPEVEVGGDIVAQSDVYSIAAIGIFALTGNESTSAHDWQKVASLAALDKEAAERFKRTFSKALAVSVGDRYATARELASAMDDLYRTTPLVSPGDHVAAANRKQVPEEPSIHYEQFDFQIVDDSHVVHLHDASVLSPESLATTKRELFEMVEEVQPTRLIVNFASVQFCSSATVGILIQLNNELKSKETRLYLCGMRESIREVFRVLNLDGSVFEIRETVTNALRSVE